MISVFCIMSVFMKRLYLVCFVYVVVFRFVIDQWLEMCMIESNAGQEIVSIIQLLRSTWIKLLEMKLEAKEKRT